MACKKKICARVISQNMLSDGIYDLRLSATEIIEMVKPGQFVGIYPNDPSKLLPRPISICGSNVKNGELRIVYRIAGKGTLEFSSLKTDDCIDIIGPLGNGYDIDLLYKISNEKAAPIVLVGGGIGIPPMLSIAKAMKEKYPDANIVSVLGYRNKDTFLDEEFKAYSDVFYSSDDGSLGVKGTVIDAIKVNEIKPSVVCACGPTPMLRGLKAYAIDNGFDAYISLEERMACGIGACLGCVCKSTEVDDHSKVNNKRVCKDGPVFLMTEVEL